MIEEDTGQCCKLWVIIYPNIPCSWEYTSNHRDTGEKIRSLTAQAEVEEAESEMELFQQVACSENSNHEPRSRKSLCISGGEKWPKTDSSFFGPWGEKEQWNTFCNWEKGFIDARLIR